MIASAWRDADLSVPGDGSEVLIEDRSQPFRTELEHFIDCVRADRATLRRGERHPSMQVLEGASARLLNPVESTHE